MNKRDLLMVKKTLAAKKIKEESRQLSKSKSSEKFSNSSSNFGHSNSFPNDTINNESFSRTSFDQSINDNQDNIHDANTLPRLHSSNSNKDDLVHELSRRSVTAKTNLRKMQLAVSKSMAFHSSHDASNSGGLSKSHSSHSFGHSTGASQESTQLFEDSYFIPKKTIVRPDGASLYDVYRSKKEDVWGKILHSQVIEEEQRKVQEKVHRLKSDEDYGRKLHQQVLECRQRVSQTNNDDEKFAKIEAETTKKREDMQKERDLLARNKYKKFVNDALEDIETRRKNREMEWKKDLEASMFMINKDKQLVEEDNFKREMKKQSEKEMQARLYQENLDFIARKAALKAADFDEDRRINAEAERKFRNEDESKKREIAKRMNRSVSGKAHEVVDQIVKNQRMTLDMEEKKRMNAENGLNIQLKSSEDAAKSRALRDGRNLSQHWEAMLKVKAQERESLLQHNNQIQEKMHEMIQKSLEEDRMKIEAKHRKHEQYKSELDQQLQKTREKSLLQLTETMSEKERKLNADLLAHCLGGTNY